MRLKTGRLLPTLCSSSEEPLSNETTHYRWEKGGFPLNRSAMGYVDSNSRENRLTGLRREVKYKLNAKAAALSFKRLSKKVQKKLVNNSFANFRISIYLDTEAKDFSRMALGGERKTVKMRIKEYYRQEKEKLLPGEQSWLEVKITMDEMVEKSRFAVAHREAAVWLSRGPTIGNGGVDTEAMRAFETMRSGNILRPLVVVHYRRATLQDQENRLRITFDDTITYHVPPPNLITNGLPCTRNSLAPPIEVEPCWVVEVKSLGTTPQWVSDILGEKNRIRYSKFETAVRALRQNGLI